MKVKYILLIILKYLVIILNLIPNKSQCFEWVPLWFILKNCEKIEKCFQKILQIVMRVSILKSFFPFDKFQNNENQSDNN